MRKQVFVFLIASVTCFAQFTPLYQTNSQLNGRYWESLGIQSKIDFIVGYSEGVSSSQVMPFVALALAKCDLDDAGNKFLNNAQQLQFPRETPYADVIKGLDKLYAEPENLPLPISSALRVLTMKFRSDKSEDIDAELRRLRILATKKSPPQ